MRSAAEGTKPGGANAAQSTMVNRTHRVVRERAQALQRRKGRARGLWVPILVCSSLLLILCSAAWMTFDEYELNPTGIPDASNQIVVLLLWFLPVSAAVLGMVWFRRTRTATERESAR